MTLPRTTRRLLLAGAASVALAAGLAWTVSRALRAPDTYFMPGELGRVPARVGAASTAPEAAGTDAPASRAYLTRAIGLRPGDEAEWGRRNGVTESIPFSHALASVFPRELYRQHPEFFPLVQGRRFEPPPGYYYWNPDLGRADTAAYAAGQAAAFFRRHPDAVSFSLGVNDGLLFGDSPETVALLTPVRWFRDRPDFSPLVFTFMNRAAAGLARTDPDKYLGCLAYYWAENAPPFRVDRHVIPFLTADRAQSYDPEFLHQELDLQRRWAAAMAPGGEPPRRLGLYDYLDGYGFLVPRLPIHAFAQHVRHARRLGFTDYYGESSRNWGLDGPLPWIMARLLQDPEYDVAALLDEYYARYFERAAEPMRRFFEACEAQWMHQPGPSYWLKYYRNEAQADLFPPDVCARLRQHLEQAAAQADSAVVRERVAFVSDTFHVTECFVAFQQSRQALAAAILRGSATEALLATYLKARSTFIREGHAVTARRPLSFYPINYDDWLRNDPTFAGAFACSALNSTGGATADTPSAVDTGEAAARAFRAGRAREILPNGGFTGTIQPGLRLAGLPYAFDIPAPWQSKVEPFRTHEATLREDSSSQARVLRISGTENSTLYQWVPATAGRIYVAAADARGQVSSSDAVMLTLGFIDAKQQPVGKVIVMRLPDGAWPDWVRLMQGAAAPANAAWVGIGLRVQHQVRGDWMECRNFSLREVAR